MKEVKQEEDLPKKSNKNETPNKVSEKPKRNTLKRPKKLEDVNYNVFEIDRVKTSKVNNNKAKAIPTKEVKKNEGKGYTNTITGGCLPWNLLERRGRRQLYINNKLAQPLLLYEREGLAEVRPISPNVCAQMGCINKRGEGSKKYILVDLLGLQNKSVLPEKRNEPESTSLKVPLLFFYVIGFAIGNDTTFPIHIGTGTAVATDVEYHYALISREGNENAEETKINKGIRDKELIIRPQQKEISILNYRTQFKQDLNQSGKDNQTVKNLIKENIFIRDIDGTSKVIQIDTENSRITQLI